MMALELVKAFVW